jgi:hypothetical protein
MTIRSARSFLAVSILLTAALASAHHGSVAVGVVGAEGPGVALDTTSPLPLGRGTAFALMKSEYASFQQRAGFSDQKQFSSFNTLALGFGVTPWLSVYALQPFNWKSQEGIGTNSGLGDTNLMLAVGFKLDEGLRFVPEKESLDELSDWHFSLWGGTSIPVGSTAHQDGSGEFFAPDMQTGFRGPSPACGLVAMKQLSPSFNAIVEGNYQHFFAQHYPEAGYHYKFGGETRFNAALVWHAWSSGRMRIDVAPELSLLHLQRDQTDDGAGPLAPMQASGGTILYGQLGARASLGPVSLGLSLKRAVATGLNEAPLQQGAEGLEAFRAALVLSYATRF